MNSDSGDKYYSPWKYQSGTFRKQFHAVALMNNTIDIICSNFYRIFITQKSEQDNNLLYDSKPKLSHQIP